MLVVVEKQEKCQRNTRDGLTSIQSPPFSRHLLEPRAKIIQILLSWPSCYVALAAQISRLIPVVHWLNG
jgi:hypothetical protein